jgi:hypothetical protein
VEIKALVLSTAEIVDPKLWAKAQTMANAEKLALALLQKNKNDY